MKAPFVGFLGFVEHSGFRRFSSGIVSDNNEEVAPFRTRKYETLRKTGCAPAGGR